MLNLIRTRLHQRPTPAETSNRLADQVFIRDSIVCQICGGLANQMICYKLGRFLSETRGSSLILDASSYADQAEESNRNFQLGFFNIRYNLILFSKEIVDSIKASNDITILAGDVVKDFGSAATQSMIDRALQRDVPNIYCDLWCALALRKQVDQFVRAHGVLDELTLDYDQHFAAADFDCIEKIERCENPVAIHVRRGDFATHDGNLLLRSDYYNDAISKLEAELSHTEFFVFSDDIGWCKQNLRSKAELHFVDFNDERTGYKDMVLASRCKHFVLSNASTFSHQIIELSKRGNDAIIIKSGKEDREQHTC